MSFSILRKRSEMYSSSKQARAITEFVEYLDVCLASDPQVQILFFKFMEKMTEFQKKLSKDNTSDAIYIDSIRDASEDLRNYLGSLGSLH